MIKTTYQASRLKQRINLLKRAKKETLRLLENWLPGDDIWQKASVCFDQELANCESQLQEFEITSKFHEFKLVGKCRNIGKDLIASRIALSWTQDTLAEKSNISRRMISQYEHDEYSQVSLKRIIQIEAALLEGFKELEDFKKQIPQLDTAFDSSNSINSDAQFES
jgi:DNA-binding XRE family transcriptional regulator